MEDYHSNENIRRAREGHAGGGRESIIQFVVAWRWVEFVSVTLLLQVSQV